MKTQNVDLTLTELTNVYHALFNIKDEHDLVDRPLLLNKTIELLSRTIASLEMLVELGEQFDPSVVSQHRDDIKCFTEMKMKLEVAQQEECLFWLSGTYH